MTYKESPSAAEIADRHRRYMALAMLAVGAMYLSKAILYLVSESAGFYLDVFQVGMAILTVALIAPVMLWKVRHRSATERMIYFSKDGFAAQALIFAQKRSWAITFILLVMLETLNNVLSRYPAEFALQLVLAIMLSTMSLLFLYKVRPMDGLALEDGDTLHA